MSYEYILDVRAQQEYEEAIRWYMQRSLKAAENFISAMDETLMEIPSHQTPLLHSAQTPEIAVKMGSDENEEMGSSPAEFPLHINS